MQPVRVTSGCLSPSPHNRSITRCLKSERAIKSAYRELRKLPCRVSIADGFYEHVEAVRAAADQGEIALYIAAQGEANVPRDSQTVHVAREVTDEVNAYEEGHRESRGIYTPRT